MRKTFRVLNEHGVVAQQFTGHSIEIRQDCVIIYDSEKVIGEYVKAVHRLAPGNTICQTEEYHFGQQST